MVDAYYAIKPRLIQLSRSLNLLFCTLTSTTSILGQHDCEASVLADSGRLGSVAIGPNSHSPTANTAMHAQEFGSHPQLYFKQPCRGLAMHSGSTELQTCPWRPAGLGVLLRTKAPHCTDSSERIQSNSTLQRPCSLCVDLHACPHQSLWSHLNDVAAGAP
ncbi:hypothetical protein C8Q70DRAFT_605332 [Cubamyces menziesii]|nr:hypothetical protein C8Q70DRAFT_605332 [Cubamyces menziesii]